MPHCLHFHPVACRGRFARTYWRCLFKRDALHIGIGLILNFEWWTDPVTFIYIRSVTTIVSHRQSEELVEEGLTFLVTLQQLQHLIAKICVGSVFFCFQFLVE